jgi:tetratricopeptide (TPR) repeat protein
VQEAEQELEAVKARQGTADELVAAQTAIGRLWADAGGLARARQAYEEAFQYPAPDQLHLRAYIRMCIADSYLAERDYARAVSAYEKALDIGVWNGTTGAHTCSASVAARSSSWMTGSCRSPATWF